MKEKRKGYLAMVWVLGLIVLAIVGVAIAVRVIPLDVAALHVAPAVQGPLEDTQPSGFTVVRGLDGSGDDTLARLIAIVAATPRTQVLAGSVETGLITFVTRSRIFGFPDATTVWVTKGKDGASLLGLHGRLQYGKADLGVNRARILDWLRQLDLQTSAS